MIQKMSLIKIFLLIHLIILTSEEDLSFDYDSRITITSNTSSNDSDYISDYISDTEEKGPCPCDITPGICDYRCCCDPDCKDIKCNEANKTCIELWTNDNKGCFEKSSSKHLSNLCIGNPKKEYIHNRFIKNKKYKDSIDDFLCTKYARVGPMEYFYIKVPDASNVKIENVIGDNITNFENNFIGVTSNGNTRLRRLQANSNTNIYSKGSFLYYSDESNNSIPFTMFQPGTDGNCVSSDIIKLNKNFYSKCTLNNRTKIEDFLNKICQSQDNDQTENLDENLIFIKLDYEKDENSSVTITSISCNFLNANSSKYNFVLKQKYNIDSSITSIGYSIDDPLIIIDKDNKTYENGFYLLKKYRDSNNQCKLGNETIEYDLSKISPIKFGRDVHLSCDYTVNETTLNSTNNFTKLLIFNEFQNMKYLSVYFNHLLNKNDIPAIEIHETNNSKEIKPNFYKVDKNWFCSDDNGTELNISGKKFNDISEIENEKNVTCIDRNENWNCNFRNGGSYNLTLEDLKLKNITAVEEKYNLTCNEIEYAKNFTEYVSFTYMKKLYIFYTNYVDKSTNMFKIKNAILYDKIARYGGEKNLNFGFDIIFKYIN